MNNCTFYLLLVIVICLTLTLGATEALPNTALDTLPELVANCPFVENSNDDGYIDEDERAIMDFCQENSITAASELSTSIIGYWELIGHGEGWIPTFSQPCASFKITEKDLVFKFKNMDLDTTTAHTWEIVDGPNGPYLDLSPAIFIFDIPSIFSEGYMFIDATPLDGNMYLYQKTTNGQSNTNLVADAGPDQTVACNNPEVTIGTDQSSAGPDITYTWAYFNQDSYATEPIIDVTQPGTYVLTVVDTATLEMAMDTVLVFNNESGIVVSINTPEPLACVADSVLLDATVSGEATDVRFEWSASGTVISNKEDIWVDTPEVYTLVVTESSTGCESVSEVAVSEQDITLETFPQDVSCFGAEDGGVEITVLGGTEPYVFEADFMLNTDSLPAGTYSITVTDATSSCSEEISFDINEPAELFVDLELIPGDTILRANVVGGVAPYTYNWNVEGNTSEVKVDLGDGMTFSVTITDDNGCTAIENIDFVADAVFNVTSTPLYVFPNPTFGQVIIAQENVYQEFTSIQVYDLLGKTVPFDHAYQGNNAIHLDLSANTQGTYLLALDLQGKLYHQKIILF